MRDDGSSATPSPSELSPPKARRRARCVFGFHHWVGHPPFGLTRSGALCWRVCSHCGKRSYGLGYHEASWEWLV